MKIAGATSLLLLAGAASAYTPYLANVRGGSIRDGTNMPKSDYSISGNKPAFVDTKSITGPESVSYAAPAPPAANTEQPSGGMDAYAAALAAMQAPAAPAQPAASSSAPEAATPAPAAADYLNALGGSGQAKPASYSPFGTKPKAVQSGNDYLSTVGSGAAAAAPASPSYSAPAAPAAPAAAPEMDAYAAAYAAMSSQQAAPAAAAPAPAAAAAPSAPKSDYNPFGRKW